MNVAPLCLNPSRPFTPERRTALERLFQKISDFTTLPTIAHRILRISQDEGANSNDLTVEIQKDPGLTAAVLRRVNSSFYGLRNRVADVKTAISLLGFQEIHNLALTVFVSRLFGEPAHHGTFSRAALWQHSVGVALAARLVSNVSGHGKPEEAYVAGLLHDIGYILLEQHLPRHFHQIIDRLTTTEPTVALEQEILTFDHAQLGHFLAQRWLFPERIADAIGFHHEPALYEGPHCDLVYIVAIANHLCTAHGWPALGVRNSQPPFDAAYEFLELDETAIMILHDELPDTFARADQLAVC